MDPRSFVRALAIALLIDLAEKWHSLCWNVRHWWRSRYPVDHEDDVPSPLVREEREALS